MTTDEARSLITALAMDRSGPALWADLGCGAGTFTLALAELLPPASTMIAVDRDKSALRSLPDQHKGTLIEKRNADLEQVEVTGPLNGILMANALHYVRDQESFLRRTVDRITPKGHFLLVEYDTDLARPPWVPYPISEARAVDLFAAIGLTASQQLGSRRSIYGPERMYAMAFRRAAM